MLVDFEGLGEPLVISINNKSTPRQPKSPEAARIG